VACPDPYGGATHLDPHLLGDWYVQNWPVIETGLYREESYALLIQFLQNGDGRWQTMLNLFEQMHQAWKTSK
jgi:hypothetical protein